jgi:hypothetical protein
MAVQFTQLATPERTKTLTANSANSVAGWGKAFPARSTKLKNENFLKAFSIFKNLYRLLADKNNNSTQMGMKNRKNRVSCAYMCILACIKRIASWFNVVKI